MELENSDVFYFESSKEKRIDELKYKRRVIPPNEHFGCQF